MSHARQKGMWRDKSRAGAFGCLTAEAPSGPFGDGPRHPHLKHAKPRVGSHVERVNLQTSQTKKKTSLKEWKMLV